MKRVLNLTLIFTLVVSVFAKAQVQTGKASFYSDAFEGKPTASGEKYRANKMTAAHKTLPFGTVVKVTNLSNNESVEVTINDRGPFVEGRVLDLSKAAAEKLGFFNQGTTEVKMEIVDSGDGKGKTLPAMVEHVTVEEREFYDFDISKSNPRGYGAQLGTYQELANLFRITDNLKKAYRKKAVVQVKVINGVKFYSLILGPFTNREKAENFVINLKREFPDAFVLDYSKQ
jgi:rare lipoprotein A